MSNLIPSMPVSAISHVTTIPEPVGASQGATGDYYQIPKDFPVRFVRAMTWTGAGLLRGVIDVIFRRHRASEYDEYYTNVHYVDFVTDDRTYNPFFFQRPRLTYYRKLQHCYELAMRDMGASLLLDPEALQEELKEANKTIVSLSRELAKAQGELEAYKERLAFYTDGLSKRAKKSVVGESQGEQEEATEEETTEEPEPVEEPQRGQDNRFTSNNPGADGKIQKKLAIAYSKAGRSRKDIASLLGLSVSSVSSYISTMGKHTTITTIQGEPYLNFDEEYGGDMWELSLYADEEEPEALEAV